MRKRTGFLLLAGVSLLMTGNLLWAGDDDLPDRVDEAIAILKKRHRNSTPIPAAVLKKAKGLAIVRVSRGGLGVGGAHGAGIVLVHVGSGWSAPCAFDVSAGSVGLQIGFEQKDFIYVLNTDEALETFTSLENTRFDAKANATAGPDHVAEEVVSPPAVYVYTSSGGAFAGATIGGQDISVTRRVNRRAYGAEVATKDILNGKVKPPKYASDLYKLLEARSER